MGFAPEISQAIIRAATARGLDPATATTIARIESGGDPRARSGSHHGLFQLRPEIFDRHGGGDIYNADDNARAFVAEALERSQRFERRSGRKPDAAELYMMWQQGEGGFAAHSGNPGGLAWQNMASTAEGRQKGGGWAKEAIWGNLTPSEQARFGSVENITSQQFLDAWRSRVNGGSAPAAVAQAAASGTPQPAAPQPQPSILPTLVPELADILPAQTSERAVRAEQEAGALARMQQQSAGIGDTGADQINRAIIAQLLRSA